MKYLIGLFAIFFQLAVQAQSVSQQSEVEYLLNNQIPSAAANAQICDVCVYKLIPKQAQIKISCDGGMQVNNAITSYPREDANTYSAKIRTSVFAKMQNLGFLLGDTHHNGSCATFTNNKGAEKSTPTPVRANCVLEETLRNSSANDWPPVNQENLKSIQKKVYFLSEFSRDADLSDGVAPSSLIGKLNARVYVNKGKVTASLTDDQRDVQFTGTGDSSKVSVSYTRRFTKEESRDADLIRLSEWVGQAREYSAVLNCEAKEEK
jgi:hypothetical protein